MLGVALSDARARRRERDAFSRETALELAGLERHIWEADWIELDAHLERQEARMTVAGVPDDLVYAFRVISQQCWRDLQRHKAQSGGEERGISTMYLDPRRAAHRAIRADLLREKDRAALRAQAIREVKAAVGLSASTR